MQSYCLNYWTTELLNYTIHEILNSKIVNRQIVNNIAFFPDFVIRRHPL